MQPDHDPWHIDFTEHEIQGQKGRSGPMSLEDANAFLASITDIPPDDLEGFVILTAVKCKQCGYAHNVVITKSVGSDVAVNLMNLATWELNQGEAT